VVLSIVWDAVVVWEVVVVWGGVVVWGATVGIAGWSVDDDEEVFGRFTICRLGSSFKRSR
jgi:hypothetical protein